MGMPQVPDRDNIPSIKEVIIQILESVALEELSMAHIINAEGEKMQALVAQIDECNVCCECISDAFKNTNTTISTLIMKEWMMLNKMTTALEIYNKFDKNNGGKKPARKSCKDYEDYEKPDCPPPRKSTRSSAN